MFVKFPTNVFDFIQYLVIPPKDKKFASIKKVLEFETLAKVPKTINDLREVVRKADGLQDDDLLFVLLFMQKLKNPDSGLPTRSILIHKRNGSKSYQVQMEASSSLISERDIDDDDESFIDQVIKA